jgi:hypothetical protein
MVVLVALAFAMAEGQSCVFENGKLGLCTPPLGCTTAACLKCVSLH